VASWFYAILEGILGLGVYISHQSLVYSVKVIDLFMLFWFDKMPVAVHTPIYLINVMVFGRVLYDIFASKKAN
jgi:hypothetical protein